MHMVRIFHKQLVLQGSEYTANDLIPQTCMYLLPT